MRSTNKFLCVYDKRVHVERYKIHLTLSSRSYICWCISMCVRHIKFLFFVYFAKKNPNKICWISLKWLSSYGRYSPSYILFIQCNRYKLLPTVCVHCTALCKSLITNRSSFTFPFPVFASFTLISEWILVEWLVGWMDEWSLLPSSRFRRLFSTEYILLFRLWIIYLLFWDYETCTANTYFCSSCVCWLSCRLWTKKAREIFVFFFDMTWQHNIPDEWCSCLMHM